jgi:hypothetical protein
VNEFHPALARRALITVRTPESASVRKSSLEIWPVAEKSSDRRFSFIGTSMFVRCIAFI